MIYAEFSPLFTAANCAEILSTAAGKLNFENFNDVINAFRKYFRKSCCSMIDAVFSSLFTGANCALILLKVMEKFVETWNMQNKVLYSLAQTAHKYCLQQRRNLTLKISMTSFAHTGSNFKKDFAAWYMQNLVLFSLPQTAHKYCQQQLGN